MRITFLFSVSLMLFFGLSGCATKYEEALSINQVKAKYLEATQKAEILNSLQTKVVATITYLNKVEPTKYSEGENFIVGIYYPSVENSSKNLGLDSDHISLYMEADGKKIDYSEKKEIKDDHPLLSQMPLFSKWYKYYIITFEPIESKKFDIVIKEESYGESKLEFESK